VRAETRRQLKQDRFAATVAQEVAWAGEHRKQLMFGGITVALLLAAGITLWYWNGQRNLTASVRLAEAQRTYEAPIVPAGTPAPPTPAEVPTFTSTTDRARAALKIFAEIADQYSSTASGKIARYYTGLCYRDAGDFASAETALKKSADDGDKERASLAKYALAEIYVAQKRDGDAANVYNDLAAHPTGVVSRPTALLQLAQMYEDRKQAEQARSVYQQIAKDDPKSPAGQYAQARVTELGGAITPPPPASQK